MWLKLLDVIDILWRLAIYGFTLYLTWTASRAAQQGNWRDFASYSLLTVLMLGTMVVNQLIKIENEMKKKK